MWWHRMVMWCVICRARPQVSDDTLCGRCRKWVDTGVTAAEYSR